MRRITTVVLFALMAALPGVSGAWGQTNPDEWSTAGQLAPTPDGLALDGDLAYPGSGDYIYAEEIGFEHSQQLWRYSLPGDSW